MKALLDVMQVNVPTANYCVTVDLGMLVMRGYVDGRLCMREELILISCHGGMTVVEISLALGITCVLLSHVKPMEVDVPVTYCLSFLW